MTADQGAEMTISKETAEVCLAALDVVNIQATEEAIARVTKARKELNEVVAGNREQRRAAAKVNET